MQMELAEKLMTIKNRRRMIGCGNVTIFATSIRVTLSILLLSSVASQLSQGQKISRFWWNELKHLHNNNNNNNTQRETNRSITNWTVNNINSLNNVPAHLFMKANAVEALAEPMQAPSSLYTPINLEQPRQQQVLMNPFSTAGLDDDNNPSDDELMTQASRLNSQMIRKSNYNNKRSTGVKAFRRAAIRFDDDDDETELHRIAQPLSDSKRQPKQQKVAKVKNYYEPIQSNNRLAAASNRFTSLTQQPKEATFDDTARSNNIWNYFDATMNGKKPSSWRSPDADPNVPSNSLRSDQDDDFISRHFKRASNGKSDTAKSQQAASSATNKENNVLKFNFSNRKKNTEEKEKWRQLIQSIFDNTPRSTDAYGPGYHYTTKTKTKVMKPIVGNKKMDDVFEKEEDENDFKGSNESGEKEMNINEEMLVDPELSDLKDEELVQDKENNDNTPDEEVDEMVEDNDFDNQYLKQANNKKDSATLSINDTLSKQSTPPSYGSRINQQTEMNNTSVDSLKTMVKKPRNIVRFTMNNDEMIDVKQTTLTTTISPTIESESSENLSDTGTNEEVDEIEDENNNTDQLDDSDVMTTPITTIMPSNFETSTPAMFVLSKKDEGNNTIELTTTVSPFDEDLSKTKRKQQRIGTWVDRKTLLFDNNESKETKDVQALNDNDVDNVVSSRRSIDTSFEHKDFITKMIARKAPIVIHSTRTARQNKETDSIDQSDDSNLAILSRTLPGVPGEDYGIFGSIPKTTFNCRNQQWPGYYSDIETKCQVFHICQQGGRRDSFLCPNGTMFNQQLFVCDWWYNVQCEEVASFYSLNEHIYDKWESNCTTSTETNRIRRMGDTKENDDESVTMPSVVEMSTLPMNTFTMAETVFGARKAMSIKGDKDGKPKTTIDDTKSIKGSPSNNKFLQFNRLMSQTSINNKLSPFLARYNFVNSQQKTEAAGVSTSPQLLTTSGSSVSSTASLFRGKYHRT